MRKAHLQYFYALHAANLDRQKLNQLADTIANTKKEMSKAATTMLLEIRSTLSVEQFEKISQMRRGQWGKAGRAGKRPAKRGR